MLRRAFIAISLLWWSGTALAADIVDATGRNVEVAGAYRALLPAGPPAAILLAVLAPDLMLGWTSPVSDEARAYLSPEAATFHRSAVDRARRRYRQGGCTEARSDCRLRHRLAALCGSCSRDTAAHRRAHIAAGRIADGNPARVPRCSAASHREGRAETLAKLARRCCGNGAPGWASACSCARGTDGLTVVAPGTDLAHTFTHLGWQVVAPAGQGSSARPASMTSARSILTSWYFPIRRCAQRSTIRTHGDHCARCAMAMRSWHLPYRSDGLMNLRRSTGCLVWRGSAVMIRSSGRPVQCRGLWPSADTATTRHAARRRPRPATVRGSIDALPAGTVPFACAAHCTGTELTVFAAASLTDAMKDVSTQWAQAGHQRCACHLVQAPRWRGNRAGAPANLFASADERWMDYLAEKKLIVAGTRKDLLGNELVLVVAADKPQHVTIGPASICSACSVRMAVSPPVILRMFQSASTPSRR